MDTLGLVVLLKTCSIFLLMCDANVINGEIALEKNYHDKNNLKTNFPFAGKVLRVLVVHVIITILFSKANELYKYMYICIAYLHDVFCCSILPR